MDDICIVNTLLWYINSSKESQTVSNNVTLIDFRRIAELWKANTRFVMSVRLSAWNNWTPTERIFVKFDILIFFESISWKFKFRDENRTRITGTLHEDQYTFSSHLAHYFLEWEMFQIKVVEKIRTHILYSITIFLFRKSCRLWDNVEKYCRTGQATDDNMAHAHSVLDK